MKFQSGYLARTSFSVQFTAEIRYLWKSTHFIWKGEYLFLYYSENVWGNANSGSLQRFLRIYTVACESSMNGSFHHLLFRVCLFVWFTGVNPAEPRCVMVLNMVAFTATQTPLSTHTQMRL